jgi:[ribosomal protein S18]-alanine N-acetyltransferase
MRPEDINSVKRIEAECGLEFWSEESYLDEIKRIDSICLSAVTEQQQLAGFITARLIMKNLLTDPKISDKMSEPEAEIYNFGTDENFRHMNPGALLFRKLLEIFHTERVFRIYLEVRESNRRAIGFYRKFGFRIVGRRKNFYRNPFEDASVMSLQLLPEEV